MSYISPLATLLYFIQQHWKTILTIIGLALAGFTAYQIGGAVAQAQPVITQAIAISSYAIPLMVYMMVFQMMFQLITTIKDMFK